MAGDGLLPVMLFQDGTKAKFKARVSVGPTFAIVNPGSETPLFRVAPGVQLIAQLVIGRQILRGAAFAEDRLGRAASRIARVTHAVLCYGWRDRAL